MPKAKLSALSLQFSVAAVKLVKALKQANETIVCDKLGLSAVAIGAHIREAELARNQQELLGAYHQALREIHLTDYYLNILLKSEVINEDVFKRLCTPLGTIRSLILTVLTKAKKPAAPLS